MIEKSKKRKGFACFLLGVSCAFCGVLGAALNETAPVQADAFTNTAIVSTAATVSSEAGVRISSNVAYEAQINGVFQGDTSFTFAFPEELTTWYAGDFVWTFTDISDPSIAFQVHYGITKVEPSGGNYNRGDTVINLNYKDEWRSSRYYNANQQWYNVKQTGGYPENTCSPIFLGSSWGSEKKMAGTLTLDWDENGVLCVKTTHYNNPERAIAAFDGTSAFQNTVSWGLPLMPFENGFTVQVSSSFDIKGTEDKGSDVTIKSITTGGTAYDCTQANSAAPAFYTNYINKKKIVVADHEDFSTIAKKDKITIPAATWQSPAESGNVTDIKVITPTQTKTVRAGEEFAPTEIGVHKIQYTAGNDVLYLAFDVREFIIRAIDQFAVKNATKSFVDGTDGAGVAIQSETAYSGQINGVFQGDTAITFKFTESDQDYVGGAFTFRISDALDESVYFDVEYSVVYTWKGNNGFTGAFVNYQGAYRSSLYWSPNTQWYNMHLAGEAAYESVYCGPNFLKRNHDLDGKLTLDYDENGKLSVLVSSFRDASSRVIATFDGTRSFVNGTSWGLPEMPFENGYKISFSSTFNKGSDVLFKSIETGGGKIAFSQNSLSANYDFRAEFKEIAQEGEDLYLPQGDEIGKAQGVYFMDFGVAEWVVKKVDLSVSANTSVVGTTSLKVQDNSFENEWKAVEKDYVLHVETPYTLSFDTQGGTAIPTILYSAHTKDRVVVCDAEKLFWKFNGWKLNGASFSGDVNDLYNQNLTLVATWLDVTAPTLFLTVNDITTLVKNQVMSVSLADVVAGDAAQNESVSVKIEVKMPNGAWTQVDSGYTLQCAQTGSYQIRYTAKDAANLETSVVREIRVVERNSPTLTASEGYKTSEYAGLSIAVANVSAQDQDGTSLNVAITVVKDGEVITLSGNSFVAMEEGVYTVTYTAKDAFNLTGIFSYQITVEADTIAPTLTTTLQDATVTPNTKITVPNAQASDNMANGLKVEVKVSYGTETIALENGEFVAEKKGVYTVTYTATDKAGNQTQKVVLITVQGEAKTSGGCKSVVSGASVITVVALGVSVITVVALGAVALLKKRKED